MNPNTAFETVTASGDHGGITFRNSDGVVVSRDFDSGYENDPKAGYPFILWANPETLTQDPTDILRVGYYYKDKNGLISYEPPIEPEELTADPLPTPEKPMKPFDLAKAKAGHPVVTRDGRRVRILTCEMNNACYTIVAIITANEPGAGSESAVTYTTQGEFFHDGSESQNDLFMAPVKREGWVNIYRSAPGGAQDCYPQPLIFNTREEAIAAANPSSLRATTRIEWEE